MKETPILFSTPMVQAIIAGTKTQTRRIIKPQPDRDVTYCHWSDGYCVNNKDNSCSCCPMKQPFGKKDDLLWVRESWNLLDNKGGIYYRADAANDRLEINGILRWKPSIHLKKKHARLWLQIVSVKVERLQDITEDDAKREGIKRKLVAGNEYFEGHPRKLFQTLWDSINDKPTRNWDSNPWVWVIEFKEVARSPIKLAL